VFFTVYYLLKQYLNSQYQMQALSFKRENAGKSTPLKLQAYERLMLFCERIAIPNLLRRIRSSEMNVGTLKAALLIALQQEYEHNLTQQLYTSENLWKIIQFAKNDAIQMILNVGDSLDPNAPESQLAEALIDQISKRELDPLEKAKQAIKQEAGLLL
ncbi:MAG: hypothetical protein AAGK97_07800, partial [Bacteroidota bacterium]